MRIGIIGAGGFGHELVAPLRQIAGLQDNPGELVFVDDDPTAAAALPILPLEAFEPGDRFVIAVGNSAVRERIEARAKACGLLPLEFRAATVVSGNDVNIGAGSVLCDFVCLTARISVGVQFQANIYSYVAHDCVIGNYVTFAPRVCCNGNVHIGDHAYIGTGAVIRQGSPDKPLRIGAHAVVGMGAVVTKDVPDGMTVIGNPARAR